MEEVPAVGQEQVLSLEEVEPELVRRRCHQGCLPSAIAVVEVKRDHPYLEDPSRSIAMEQLVTRLPLQLEHREPLLACLHHFHQYLNWNQSHCCPRLSVRRCRRRA